MQKVEIQLVDDTDGSEAAETVSFGLDGNRYEIDLSALNAGELRATVGGYVDHARKTRAVVTAARQRDRTAGNPTTRMREWLQENGYGVPDLMERGRIPGWLVERYERKIPQSSPEAEQAASDAIDEAKEMTQNRHQKSRNPPAEPADVTQMRLTLPDTSAAPAKPPRMHREPTSGRVSARKKKLPTTTTTATEKTGDEDT